MRSEGDVVLIYHEDQPMAFARIEIIEPDVKKGWYQVTLQFLTIPPQVVTWILKDEYIDGFPFTMGGRSMRLEEVIKITKEKVIQKSDRGAGKDASGSRVRIIPFKRPGESSERKK